LVGKPEGKGHLEEQCVDESITLRWISSNRIADVDWFRAGTSGGLFWTQYKTTSDSAKGRKFLYQKSAY
jgi:hypothetical protein